MNFLKTAFWVIIAVALALFTKANWAIAPSYSGYVPVKLWGDIILETRLPVLIVVAFLLGLLPTWLWGRACRWHLQRKLSSAERALASTTGIGTSPSGALPSSDITPPPSAADSSLPITSSNA